MEAKSPSHLIGPLAGVCASPEACTQVPLVEASTVWSPGVDAGTTRWKGTPSWPSLRGNEDPFNVAASH